MGVVYSMYDALVSINVPTEKAKAVIDAMEREMMDKIATKPDLEHVQAILSRDITRVEERVTASIKTSMAEMESKLTVRLGLLMGGLLTAAAALVATAQYFR
jgi:hypothetical protein